MKQTGQIGVLPFALLLSVVRLLAIAIQLRLINDK